MEPRTGNDFRSVMDCARNLPESGSAKRVERWLGGSHALHARARGMGAGATLSLKLTCAGKRGVPIENPVSR